MLLHKRTDTVIKRWLGDQIAKHIKKARFQFHRKSYMWIDLRKAGFHTHNSKKTHFSPSHNGSIYWLTKIQASISAESFLAFFYYGLRCPRVLGWVLNGSISPGQVDSWLSITTWLAGKFGHGFSCFVKYVEQKWHQWMPFGCYSVDVAFACYFMAPHHPLPFTPIRVLVVLAIQWKTVKWWEI